MRGIGKNLSRLPHARAIIAGAALLAGIVSAQAQQSDETALAVPRILPPGGGEIGLPQPLAPSEARRVRRIFALQALGEMAEAAQVTAQLDDPTLLGDILADRFLGASYRATAAELAAWIDRYADLPDAPAIRAQLLLRPPRGGAVPDVPPPVQAMPAPPEDADPADLALHRNPGLDRAVHDRLHADRLGDALRLIERQRKLDPSYAAELRAEVARAAFAGGDYDRAFRIAGHALRQSGGRIALAGFVAGIAAWQLDRIEPAASLFEQSARAALAPASLRAAGAFWAARAHLRLNQAAAAREWLRRAGAEPRTFYGLLARRMLGIGPNLYDNDDPETLGEADIAAVDATPFGHRALALLQVGQTLRAEAALRQLWPAAQGNPAFGRSVLLVAKAAGLTDLAAELAALLQAADGKPRDDLRFPMPQLHPRGGFRVDPAIIYGLARLESNFDADAVSPAGARGLMQLMPVAAGAVSTAAVAPGALARRLADPALNLELGQKYLLYLAGQEPVDGDLIRLLASYNAGPASAARWMDAVHDGGDPLVFIESIPLDETRDYVRRALTYIWIYAGRLGIPAPGLDELAAGRWPRFPAGGRDPDVLASALTKAGARSQVMVHLH